jgi:hypothetical protein
VSYGLRSEVSVETTGLFMDGDIDEETETYSESRGALVPKNGHTARKFQATLGQTAYPPIDNEAIPRHSLHFQSRKHFRLRL